MVVYSYMDNLKFCLLFFLFIPYYASSLNFSFSTIGTNNNDNFLNLTGNASVSTQGIQVTPNDRRLVLNGKTGRATYFQPLHLWDNASRNLTDFTTHFTLVIDSAGSPNYADGLTFFMAPVNSSIPDDAAGEGIALTSRNATTNVSLNHFVAVEFDTFSNAWDPRDPHVGISINSMASNVTATWWNNISLGRDCDAWINYDSASYNLSVIFTGFSGNITRQGSVSYKVDLRDYLPERVTFGFSGATGLLFETNTVKSWEFSSTLVDDENVKVPTTSPTPDGPDPNIGIRRRRKNKTGLFVGLGVSLPVVLGGFALVVYGLWKKKKTRERKQDDFGFELSDEFERGSGPKKFSYEELSRATSNFSEEEKLGQGGFGGVYKGFLRELNSYVAVKRVSRGSRQGIKEYASEVRIISRLRHRNLVQLIGWCHENGELLLVYELMPNGSLDSHLFKGKSLLTWGARYKIAQGLATALLYLHEEWEQCVVHRDIKSSNVMLDSNFNAKLGDFGLARFVDHEKGSQTTVLAGTFGYMAPECHLTGQASRESDVYSFGIVALEIACGRKPIDPKVPQENQIRMVEWVWELYGMEKLLEAADPKLSTEFDQPEMEHLMIVGLWCAHPDSNLRPSIKQAIHVLNFEAPLPILPPKMPVATYFTPSVVMPTSSLYGATNSETSQNQSTTYNTDSSMSTSSASSSQAAPLLYTR